MKKFILVVALFLVFAGVATASSLNGDYKGNPIVNVTINGNKVNSDVPAIIYEGSTLIPLRSAAEALGANVSWDSSTLTASLSTNSNTSSSKNGAIGIAANLKLYNDDAVKWNASNVKYEANVLGSYFSADVKGTDDIKKDIKNIAGASTYVIDSDADMIFINYYSNNILLGYYMILKSDAQSMTHFSSIDEYQKTWKWNPNRNSDSTPPPAITPAPTAQVQPVQPPVISTESAITSQTSGDFNGFENGKIFELANGQIWKQTSFDYYYYYYFMPKVTIYKDGTQYKMVVDGVDKTVTVERIK